MLIDDDEMAEVTLPHVLQNIAREFEQTALLILDAFAGGWVSALIELANGDRSAAAEFMRPRLAAPTVTSD